MLIDISNREVDLTDDEIAYLNSFGANLSKFVASMRSPHVDDMLRSLERHAARAGVADEAIFAALGNSQEIIYEDKPRREDAIRLLKPMLKNDEPLADTVYNYIRLLQTISNYTYAYSLNILALAEPQDPTIEASATELKTFIKQLGHGDWEAARITERLNEALDEHSKDYVVSSRGR